MGQGAPLLLGSGPSQFEATRQPSKGRPETEDLRPDPLTGMPEGTEKTELLSDAEMYEGWAMDLLEEVSVRVRVRVRANPNPNPNNPHPHPHPPTLTLIQAQVEEDAPAVLLALPLMTRAVEYSPQVTLTLT